MRLLSDVGLMTIMRGTAWGDRKPLNGVFPRFRESNESLLWLASLLRMLRLSLVAPEMSLVRLWLRLLVRTSRGRVAMVRDLDTSSCSQVLKDSFMADGCWQCKKRNERKRRTNWREHEWMKSMQENNQTTPNTWDKGCSFINNDFFPLPSLLFGFWLAPGAIAFCVTCLCMSAWMMTCSWRNHQTSCPKAPSLHPSKPEGQNRTA